MPSFSELQTLQAMPLTVKTHKSMNRIREWVREYGEDGVYISFSGGKDSTVLVDLVDKAIPNNDIPLVFVDTGLEYPEIREFVKSYGDRVVWVKPAMNFKKVIENYGYPFIGKEVSRFIGGAQRWKRNNCPDLKFNDLTGDEDICKTMNCDAKIMMGRLERKENGVVIEGEFSKTYNKKKYKFMVDAPVRFSHHCCNVMKKKPLHDYVKETDRKAITGQMASESKLRAKNWLQHGCNGFDLKYPISNPLSFWTEQDILEYVKQNNLHICSVYGEVVEDVSGTEEVEGQMTISDIEGFEDCELFDAKRPALRTTGCQRTGCMFCGYGCHLEKSPNRFEMMKETHPKQYEWIMKPWDEGGLGYKDVIDWINEHGNLNIKY